MIPLQINMNTQQIYTDPLKHDVQDGGCQEHNQEEQTLLRRQTQEISTPYTPRRNEKSSKYLRSVLVAIGFLLVSFLVLRVATHSSTVHLGRQESPPVDATPGRLPRILWVLTENEREAEPMHNDVYLRYLVHRARSFDLEVRVVDPWSAYDWITPATTAVISKTMQNSKIDETVHTLLRLALLMENGGLMASWGTLLLGEGLGWLEEMFTSSREEDPSRFECSPGGSFLYMPQRHHAELGWLYSQDFVAAVPDSTLLREAFALLAETISTGQLPFEVAFEAFEWNEDTMIHFFPQSFSRTVSLAAHRHRQQSQGAFTPCSLGLQQPSRRVELEFLPSDEFHLLRTMVDSCGLQKYLRHRKVDSEVFLLTGVNRKPVEDYLGQLVRGTAKPEQLSNQSLLSQVLSAPGNKEVFLQPLPPREVELCLVVMEGLNLSSLEQAAAAFRNQTFQNWRLVLPVLNASGVPEISDSRVVVMPAKSTKVHNIQKAVTKHCQSKGYAILLNRGERFSSQDALMRIARAAEPRQIVGLFITLQRNKCPLTPKKKYTIFNRESSGIVNPQLQAMIHILNHFRIISIQTFLQIPQFAMRDMYGKYFQDRLIFLMDLLDQQNKAVAQASKLYLIKKNAHLYNVPLRIQILNEDIRIQITELQEVSLQQLLKTRTRLNTQDVNEQLRSIIEFKVSFSKLLAQNPGDDFVSVDERRGPDLIPKIIHQVWLGTSDLPPAKKYCYEKAKKLYPSYEVKLWREENVTREAFPMTYELIRTLIEFNRRSPYNKLASVTDIMRHEILYHEGGFWKDAGMNLLRPVFDKFLKYKLVLPVDRLFKYRYLQGMCFFANAPKYENLMRINSFRNLNRMRIYQTDAMTIAGPVDFRQLLVGQEQFDPDILLLPYETFYPGQIGQHPQGDLCTKRKKNMKYGQNYQIQQNGWYLLSNCAQLYPFAFAIEHNRYGNTWNKRKPK